ncbi:MAG: type 2 isopentenyl-diphosphate Delta-isomerase [Candidatus Heimdallarchaeota archaeon]
MTESSDESQLGRAEADQTIDRKFDHIRICLEEKVTSNITNGLGDVSLVHMAAPEMSFSDVDVRTRIFGKNIEIPLVIAAMTGGHPKTGEINSAIAEVAEETKVAFGLGSQRAGVDNSQYRWTYSVARERAPSIPILGNLGAPQFNMDYGLKEAQTAVAMVDADALAIHFNPLQEAVQPEGETDFASLLQKLADIQSELSVPIVIKEVGSGISGEIAKNVQNLGFSGIDVGGLGGTSWAAVEALRAKAQGNEQAYTLGEQFRDWGIPTAFSLAESRANFSGTIIATGGVRNGIEAAKLLALGADAVGIALPFLKEASKSKNAIVTFIENFKRELQTTMFLVGAHTLQELKKVPLVITGKMRSWLLARGFKHFQINSVSFRDSAARLAESARQEEVDFS